MANELPSDENQVIDDDPLVLDIPHARESSQRWDKIRNRDFEAHRNDIPDIWTVEQCGLCRFYIPLRGALGSDWGVCSNPASEFDRQVMFEHDGCDAYSGASEWVTAYLAMIQRRNAKQRENA